MKDSCHDARTLLPAAWNLLIVVHGLPAMPARRALPAAHAAADSATHALRASSCIPLHTLAPEAPMTTKQLCAVLSLVVFASAAHATDVSQLHTAMNGAGAVYQRCAFKAVAARSTELKGAESSATIASRALASCGSEQAALDQAVRAVSRAERPQADAAAEARASVRAFEAAATLALAKEIDRVRDQAGVGPGATGTPLPEPFRVTGRMEFRTTSDGLADSFRRVCLKVPSPHAATILRSVGEPAGREVSTTLCMSHADNALKLLGISGEPPYGTCGFAVATVDVDLTGIKRDGYGAGATLAKVHQMSPLTHITCK